MKRAEEEDWGRRHGWFIEMDGVTIGELEYVQSDVNSQFWTEYRVTWRRPEDAVTDPDQWIWKGLFLRNRFYTDVVVDSFLTNGVRPDGIVSVRSAQVSEKRIRRDSPRHLRIISVLLILAGLPLYFAVLNGQLGASLQRHSQLFFIAYLVVAPLVTVLIEWKIRPWFSFEIRHSHKMKHRMVTLFCLALGVGMYFLARQGYLGAGLQSAATVYLVIILITFGLRAILTELGVRRRPME